MFFLSTWLEYSIKYPDNILEKNKIQLEMKNFVDKKLENKIIKFVHMIHLRMMFIKKYL